MQVQLLSPFYWWANQETTMEAEVTARGLPPRGVYSHAQYTDEHIHRQEAVH